MKIPLDAIKNWQDEEKFRKETWQSNASRCLLSGQKHSSFVLPEDENGDAAWKSIRWEVSKCGWGVQEKGKDSVRTIG